MVVGIWLVRAGENRNGSDCAASYVEEMVVLFLADGDSVETFDRTVDRWIVYTTEFFAEYWCV